MSGSWQGRTLRGITLTPGPAKSLTVLLVAAPLIFYQLWTVIAAGLDKKEKRIRRSGRTLLRCDGSHAWEVVLK